MHHRSLSLRAGLGLALAAMLVPAGAVVAQTDSPSDPPAAAGEVVATAPSLAWAEVEGIEGLTEGVRIAGLTSKPGGPHVLYGTFQRSVKGGGFRVQPRAWVSTDGSTWQPTTLKGADQIRSIAGGEAGFVAVAEGDGFGSDDDRVWFSADGAKWRAVKLPKAARGRINDVIATPEGFLAVGGVGERTKSGRGVFTTSYHPAAWTSPDGKTWTRQQFSDLFGEARGVAQAPDGTVLALGEGRATSDFDSEGGPTGWRLEEGAWSEVASAEGFLLPVGMGHAADRFFVPYTGFSSGVLTSIDGTTWEAGPQRLPPGSVILPAPEGVLAVGTRPPFVAASSDWEAWVDAAIEGIDTSTNPTPVIAVRLDDGRIVLVTSEVADAEKGTQRSRLWIWTPAT